MNIKLKPNRKPFIKDEKTEGLYISHPISIRPSVIIYFKDNRYNGCYSFWKDEYNEYLLKNNLSKKEFSNLLKEDLDNEYKNHK